MIAVKVIGLDLGARVVRACELELNFRTLDVRRFYEEEVIERSDEEQLFDVSRSLTEEPTPPPHPLQARAEAARRLIDRHELRGEPIAAALPRDLCATLRLTLPFTQSKQIEQILPFQIDDAIPFDVEELVYDYLVLSQSEDESELLVAYTHREQLQEALEVLQGEEIDPKLLTVGCLSYLALDGLRPSPVEEPELIDEPTLEEEELPPKPGVLFLDIGERGSDLLLFDEKGPVQSRPLGYGGRALTDAIAEAFQVDRPQAEQGKLVEGLLVPRPQPPETTEREAFVSAALERGMSPLLREVLRSCAHYESREDGAIERIVVAGASAELSGLSDYLTVMTQIPVERYQSSRLRGLLEESAHPAFSRSLGLAMTLAQPNRAQQVNFRQGDFNYTGDFGFLRARLLSVGLAVVAMLALTILDFGLQRRALEAEHQQLLVQQESLSQELLSRADGTIDDMNFAIRRGARDLQRLPENSAFQTLGELSEALSRETQVDLDDFEVDFDRGSITLQGLTGSVADVSQIEAALQRTRCFQGPVKREKVQKTRDNRTRFRLSAAASCS